VGTATGELFFSTNGGKEWQAVPWTNDVAVRLVAETPYRQTLLIALSERAGLYLFRPHVWRTPRFARRSPTFPVLDVIADSSLPYSLYAACGKHGLWLGERHGEEWDRVPLEAVEEGEEILFVAQSGAQRERLLFACGREFCLRSSDGRRWKRVLEKRRYRPELNPTRAWRDRPSGPTCLEGSPSPEILFLSDYWSLYRTTNAGGDAVWDEVPDGAANQVINALAVDDRGNLYVAADRAGLLVSTNGGATYQAVMPQKYATDAGQYTAVSLGKENLLVTAAVTKWRTEAAVYWGNAGLRQVTARAEGVEGTRIIVRGPPEARGPWALAASPARAELTFLAIAGEGARFLVSQDGAKTWQPRPVPEGVMPGRGLAADFDRPEWVYLGNAASAGGLWVSENAGAGWKRALETSEPVADVAAAPKGSVYVLGTGGTVWRSETRGLSWLEPGALNAPQARDLCVDPRNPKRLYAATAGRIFASADGGVTWNALPAAPLRLPPLTCLAVDPKANALFVGTQGAGVWKIDLAE
jgi:photosystem II stability/assembly factor-like uncharacterized protein